jgi:hypothetical protein
MQQEELLKFIKEELQNGASQEIIRETLVKFGYAPEEIDNLLLVALNKTVPQPAVPQPGYSGYAMPSRPEIRTEFPDIQKEPIVPPVPPIAPEPPKFTGTESPKPTRSSPVKKILVSVIAVVVLIALACGAVFAYNNFAKVDPISMLPKDTAFFLRFKINSQNEQVKNFQTILNTFPYYAEISKKISEQFDKEKKDNPALENLDFAISDEMILAYTGPYPTSFNSASVTSETNLVLIITDPDLKKLKAISDALEKELASSTDWKIEKEDYKGKTIFKITPQEKKTDSYSYSASSYSEQKIFSTYAGGHFILAMNESDIKKIIDIAEDQKITNVFKKDKLASVKSNAAFNKLKTYASGDYLALFYGQMSLTEILKGSAKQEVAQAAVKSLPNLQASLKTALSLPFLSNKEDNTNSDSVAFLFKISATKSQLNVEGYSLDMRKDAITVSSFPLDKSLSKYLPEKFGNQDVMYFSESANLKEAFDTLKKTYAEEISTEDFDKAMVSLNQLLGVDLEEDILPIFEKNYALVAASEPSGKEMPILALVSEVDDITSAKEDLLKISIPKDALNSSFNPVGDARQKAKDAAIKGTLDSLRAEAEMSYDDNNGSYGNVYCSYDSSISRICSSIKTQIGSQPIIRASSQSYCAYSPLNKTGAYYCVDSTGRTIETYINPGAKYCTWTSFSCPTTQGQGPSVLVEKTGFKKETVKGFDIYSLPIADNFSLSFATDDNKIIFAISKDSLVSILGSLNDKSIKRLNESAMFAEQFGDIPKEVSGISYAYPYGLSGTLKFLVGFLYNSIGSAYLGSGSKDYQSQIVSAVNELIDKGISPYLKVLKTEGAYTYNIEKGLNGVKEKIIIQELSASEKASTEKFWANIKSWFNEKSQIMYSY